MCADGRALAATAFKPASQVRGAVVIAAALGVPRRFYAPFSRFVAESGFAVVTFDYRGVGDSHKSDVSDARLSMQQWGELDIDAALAHALHWFRPPALVLLGHSCGGQLFGLAPHCEKLHGVILVGAQTAYWRGWPFPWNLGIIALFYALVPLLSLRRGNFPARVLRLSSVDVPCGVTAQWARWARSPRYLFDPRFRLDTGRYQRLRVPVLALGLSDDNYSPAAAIESLLREIPNAAIEHRQIKSPELNIGNIGHFGFFREKARDPLWRDVLEWLTKLNQ